LKKKSAPYYTVTSGPLTLNLACERRLNFACMTVAWNDEGKLINSRQSLRRCTATFDVVFREERTVLNFLHEVSPLGKDVVSGLRENLLSSQDMPDDILNK
jgi:nicotinate-nucleotide pyrophosphorylase